MLQVLHDQAREVGADGGGPLVRAESEAGATAPHTHAQVHTYRNSNSARRQQQQRSDRCGSVSAGRQELHACAVGVAQAKWETVGAGVRRSGR